MRSPATCAAAARTRTSSRPCSRSPTARRRRSADMTKTKVQVGYGKIRKTLEVDVPEGEPKPWDADTKLDVVGRGVPRIDGHLKVSGAARYTTDVREKGMLHAAVLRCPLPCARVKSIAIGR